jgi:hypothetical protein
MLAYIAPLLAFNFAAYIPWAVLFLLIKPFGVRMYYLKKREECSRIQKRIQGWCTHTTDGGKGYGYSFGYWYAVSVSILDGECGSNYTVYMIATETSFAALTKEMEDEIEEDEPLVSTSCVSKRKINVYERTGSYMNMWLRRRERDATDEPKPQQEAVVKSIIAHHKKHRHTVVYIHGPPCTGKSMIGVLVANEFGGSFCNTLKPWQPGDTIAMLHSEVEPTYSKPIVLTFDEIDTAIVKIHKGIEPHPKIPTSVADKAGWNHMLDEVQRRMYPDLIIIMTSNRSPQFINQLDPSYLRSSRVNLFFEMTESLEN